MPAIRRVARFVLRVAGYEVRVADYGLMVSGGWLERLKAQGARLKAKTTNCWGLGKPTMASD